jgi:hypothetical protein
MQIQFDSPKAQFKCSPPESLRVGQASICDSIKGDTIPGTYILEHENINDLPWYMNLIILLCICIIVRCAAYFSLSRNSRRIKK